MANVDGSGAGADETSAPAIVASDGSGEKGGRGMMLVFALIAVGLGVGFALITNHIWEDYFITFRYSRNLCLGYGLVFSPGERVHGFTSPLGVLLPAVFYYAIGQQSYLPALWVFRLLSLACYAGAGVILLRRVEDRPAYRRAAWVSLAVLYLLCVTLLDFTINGMETGIMALAVAATFACSVGGNVPRGGVALGMCWAGLMWTRPDGFVYAGALVVAQVVCGGGFRRGAVVPLVRSAVVCAGVYLPWFVWAWWYYGSPIPHTVIAKSNVDGTLLTHIKEILPNIVEQYANTASRVFRPAYFMDARHWHPGLLSASNVLAVVSAGYWMLPVRDAAGRVASLAFALVCGYLTIIPVLYPWYLPPAATLGLFAFVSAVWTLVELLQVRGAWVARAAVVCLGLLVIERAVMFVEVTVQMRIQQEEVETRGRMAVGLWLKDRVKPGERVFLEPLGYIGYFSNDQMMDWPGLVTPEVVRLRSQEGFTFLTIVPRIKPEWLVWRETEAEIMAKAGDLGQTYTAVARFDAKPRLKEYPWIPGKHYLDTDATFVVFQRNDLTKGAGGTQER